MFLRNLFNVCSHHSDKLNEIDGEDISKKKIKTQSNRQHTDQTNTNE